MGRDGPWKASAQRGRVVRASAMAPRVAAAMAPAAMSPPRERQESTENVDCAESREPALIQEPVEATESAEPIEPMDSTLPTEPMESTEPTEPMDSTESWDHRERDPEAMRVMLPHERGTAPCLTSRTVAAGWEGCLPVPGSIGQGGDHAF